MAHSPTIFRYIWGELFALKRHSPVSARYFELAVVVASSLNACQYCISHHTPLAAHAGYSGAQLDYLLGLRLAAMPDTYEFPPRPLFTATESLIIDLAYFILWSGIYAPQHQVPLRHVHTLKHRFFPRLQAAFSAQQIEELTWRITQCVAFNWHNDFLELGMEAGVTPVLATVHGA